MDGLFDVILANGCDQKKVDPIMVVLLNHSLMFSTDFIELKNAQSVSRVQHQYLKLLHRYLKFKYGSNHANSRLHNGIMIGSFAREISEIRQHRLPV